MQSSVPRELAQNGTNGESLGCCSCPENEFSFSETIEHYNPLLVLFAPVPRCLIPVHQQSFVFQSSVRQTNAIKLEMIMLHF